MIEGRDAFQRYLDGRGAGLNVTAFVPVSGGFETAIHGIRVAREGIGAYHEPLLPLDEPLVLRVYSGPGVAQRSRWEAAVIPTVRAAGVPAPEVYLYEADGAALGGPFLVLGLAAGERFDQAALRASPLTVVRMIRNFARMQAQIFNVDWREGHTLAAGTGRELGPFAWAPDRLAAARAALVERNLDRLLPLVDWLERERHLIDGEPEVLIHGDYHPLNVFMEGARVSGIIDWGAGGFATKYEDAGWSSLLIATASAVDAGDDKDMAPFRSIGHRAYLTALWEACRVRGERLRYGEVYAGLRWLLLFLPSYLDDAGPAYLNADARAFATPRFVGRVRRFIEQRSGLKLPTD